MYSVIIVPSISHALRAEKILQAAGVACKLIPVPRHLSSDCGVCVRIRQEDQEAADAALRQAGLEIVGIYGI
ncbi:MAG: DUF3343 domain-containing protein [Anaerolineae bacterium]